VNAIEIYFNSLQFTHCYNNQIQHLKLNVPTSGEKGS